MIMYRIDPVHQGGGVITASTPIAPRGKRERPPLRALGIGKRRGDAGASAVVIGRRLFDQTIGDAQG
jgi:hypothetical protein